MKHTLFILIGAVLMITACQSETEEPSLVDYAQLPEIGVELAVETGENEDYLPGRMYELVSTLDGGFLVSDLQTNTIEQFSTTGEHLATIAREGRGPGELTFPFQMISAMDNDTLTVRNSFSGQFDYFAPGQDGVYSYHHSVVPGQAEAETAMLTILGHFSNAEFLAGEFTRAPATFTDEEIDALYWEVTVLLINEHGEVVDDSLHTLTLPNFYSEVSGGVPTVRHPIPYLSRDRLLPLESGHYLVARPGSGTITFYDSQHSPENEIELNVAPRPVTASDLDFHFEYITSNSLRNAIEERVPEFKPPFMDIWVSDDYILLLIDRLEEGNEFVVISREGSPLGRFILPDQYRIEDFRGNRLYTLYRNPETGDQVRVYELDM